MRLKSGGFYQSLPARARTPKRTHTRLVDQLDTSRLLINCVALVVVVVIVVRVAATGANFCRAHSTYKDEVSAGRSSGSGSFARPQLLVEQLRIRVCRQSVGYEMGRSE